MDLSKNLHVLLKLVQWYTPWAAFPFSLRFGSRRVEPIDGLCVGIDSVEVSHLQFTDDIIFFSSENEDKFENLVNVIQQKLLIRY